MSENSYAAIMTVLATVTCAYLLAIGFNRHTPRMRRPLSESALAKLRLWSKVAGAASLLLAVLYGYAWLAPR